MGLWDQFISLLGQFIDQISNFMNASLFSIGESNITLWSILYFILAVILLFYVATRINKILVNRILARYHLDIGIRQAIGTITKYFILVIGLIIIFQSAGLNLSALSLLAGALGVGIGFGLQNITNNFISGIIILFERPIKVGDRIETEDIVGDVKSISARATTILTNDNISVIVPNSEFISSRVTNWSHNDRKVRFRFPVGVAYKEDPEQVKKILMEVMDENPNVLDYPPPDVWFEAFGSSSLDFNIIVWTYEYINRPNILKSQLYFAIFKKFKEHKIEIPFPQRDLHFKSGIIPVTQEPLKERNKKNH